MTLFHSLRARVAQGTSAQNKLVPSLRGDFGAAANVPAAACSIVRQGI